MAMTQKEARRYASDPANWSVVKSDDLVRYSELIFKGLHYVMVEIRSVDVLDHWKKAEHPKLIWTHEMYYKLEHAGDAVFTTPVRMSLISAEIWEADRAE